MWNVAKMRLKEGANDPRGTGEGAGCHKGRKGVALRTHLETGIWWRMPEGENDVLKLTQLWAIEDGFKQKSVDDALVDDWKRVGDGLDRGGEKVLLMTQHVRD